jgi:subtilisin-like proprotein convertase family protein
VDVPYTNGRGTVGQWVGVETARIFRNDLVDIPGVMHVAALASTAQRSHYSNYGPGIGVCAPSSNVHLYRRMVVPGLGITTTTGSATGVTASFGGTSSATPLVAGVAALVLSANSNLTALEVEAILKRTASKDLNLEGYPKTPPASYDLNPTWDISPIPPFDSGAFTDTDDPNGSWSPWFGHGRVDAPAAVSAALALLGDSRDVDEISASSSPNLDIPDNTPAGVQDVISLDEAGRVAAITVEVDIAHTWIGDLRVVLVAPDGSEVMLHNRSGGNADNIRQSWTLESLPVLGALVDKATAGPWTLKVADLGKRDTGALRSWGLHIRPAAARLAATDEAALAIPDNKPAGVTRRLALEGDESVQELAVSVDITHTWIGDLRVTLTSPEGTAVVLHNQAGGSADNLIRTWRSQEEAGLRVLRGQAAAGDWMLNVADLAARDVGKLNRWALDVTP